MSVLTAPAPVARPKPEEYLVCWLPTPAQVVKVRRVPMIDIGYIVDPPPGAFAAVFTPHEKSISDTLGEVIAGFFGIHERRPHFYLDGELLTLRDLEKIRRADWYLEQLIRGHSFHPRASDPVAIRINGAIHPFHNDDVYVPSLKH